MRRRLFWLAVGTLVGVAASALTERRIRRAAARFGAARLRRSLAARPAEAADRLRRMGREWIDAGRTDPGRIPSRPRSLGRVPAPRYSHRPVH